MINVISREFDLLYRRRQLPAVARGMNLLLKAGPDEFADHL
jgi:hypothetical protein